MTTFSAKIFHPTTYKLLHETSGFDSYESAVKWILKVTDNSIIGSIITNIQEESN